MAVGLNQRQMAQRRAAHVDELADGTVRITAMRPIRGGWEAFDDAEVDLLRPDGLAIAAAVAAALAWDPLAPRR